MKIALTLSDTMILHGDCLEKLKSMEDDSVDSLVTDPPAGISFMGKAWDDDKGGRKQWIAWLSTVMKEALRVMKPGAHGLVWAIPRTSHWTATALEDAGFEVRDVVVSIFGSGFPKSLNINKQLQKNNLVCQCRKDVLLNHSETMRNMSQNVASERPIPGRTQPDMRLRMPSRDAQSRSERCNKKAKADLSDMRESLSPEEQDCSEQSQDLQLQMPGCPEVIQTGDVGASKASLQTRHTGGTNTRKPKKKIHADGKEPSLERRGDLQAQQGQLHRPEVCQVSEGIHGDGPKGRLHNGTPSSDGETFGAPVNSNGSSAPQGSQYEEQSDIESGVISKQRSTQTCRSCGKAVIPEGLGTALKPASEHWILVRKPCSEKTVAANVLKHGCGGLNIDASRIGYANETDRKLAIPFGDITDRTHTQGRFPANLLLSHNDDCVEVGTKKVKSDGHHANKTIGFGEREYKGQGRRDGTETVSAFECTEGCAVAELDRQSGVLKTNSGKIKSSLKDNTGYGGYTRIEQEIKADSGGASRFFFQVKHDTKSECRHTFASFVKENFKTILPIIESIVLSNAEEKHVELLAQNVSSVVNQCGSCATLIAQDLVAIKNLASKKKISQAYQDFIGNSKSSILIHNLAFIVEQWVNTDTIPTIQNLSILFGCVPHVIEGNIKQESLKSEFVPEQATRFLYCAKASKSEKNAGCEGLPEVEAGIGDDRPSGQSMSRLDGRPPRVMQNVHPTVKPIKLMSYLIKMITPPNGTVLDPFAGSGSTGVAAIQSGFKFIGIEREKKYVEIANKRIYHAMPEFKKQIKKED